MKKSIFWKVIGWLCGVSWGLNIIILIGRAFTGVVSTHQNSYDPTLLLIATILAFAYSDYLKSKQVINEST